MISQEERVAGANAIKLAVKFKTEMVLSAPDADGFQVITMNPAKMPQIPIGAFKAGEVYSGVLIKPGQFQGAGIFEGLSFSGATGSDVGGHWLEIRDNLLSLVDDWLIPTLAPDPAPAA